MSDFCTALREAGYEPPNPILDNGKFQRFGKNNAHWLVSNGVFGVAGDWRGELPRVRWHISGTLQFTPQEKAVLHREIKAAHEARLEDKQEHEIETAKYAQSFWQDATENTSSPYLIKKLVSAIGLRVGKDKKNGKRFLAVPLCDENNFLWSIQKIFDDGTKLFLKGGRKHGCFHVLGNSTQSNKLYFCEGYATSASVYLAANTPTIVCFDAGNLEPVIAALRNIYPDKRFIIAGDNDAYGMINSGKEKAHTVAQKYGCEVALPVFANTSTKPTDFNDLHVLEGLDMVRAQLQNTIAYKAPDAHSEWPEPDVSLVLETQSPAPEMVAQCLPAQCMEWVQESAKDKSCPSGYTLTNLLVTASACVGNAYRVAPNESWVEQPHIWGGNVGKPSDGKTASMNDFIDVLKTLEVEEEDGWKALLTDHEKVKSVAEVKMEAWKKDIEKATKEGIAPPDCPPDAITPDKPIKPRTYLQEGTTQQILNILSGNPKGLLQVRDELSAWIGSFDRYSGSGADKALYLEAWNGSSHTVDLVKNSEKPLCVPYASLAILGGVQPEKLKEVLNGTDDGFASRFCFVYPDPVPYAPLRVKDTASITRKRCLLDTMRRLRQLQMDVDANGKPVPKIVGLSPDALKLFEHIRSESLQKARESRGLIAGWHGKNPARALRIALVVEFLAWAFTPNAELPCNVSAQSMAHAGTCLDYYAAMFERVVGCLVRQSVDEDAVIIAKYIHKNGESLNGILNERALYQTAGYTFLRDDKLREAALDGLVKHGWITQKVLNRSRGRRPNNWTINPKIWGVS